MDLKLPLAVMLIAGGVVGMVLPTEDRPGARADRTAVAAEQEGDFSAPPQVNIARTPVDSTVSGWSDDVVLEREGDGHFYANVRVDGRDFRMLVDTGATVVALTAEDAQMMGLTWHEDDVRPVAQGASGPVYGVNTTIDRMAIGGLEAQAVRAIIITQGAAVSLLGQSYLSTLGSVEIAGDQMVLGQ